MIVLFGVVTALLTGRQAGDLRITLVGNAGVMLSDGATTLLVDLPYESGAFGYQTYDPDALQPAGTAVAVVTHDHRDHFALDLFRRRPSWSVIGPRGITERLPASRVLPGDSVAVGGFSVVAIPTPHIEGHRSYRVRWGGKVLYFTGDTEVPAFLGKAPPIDILFVTPWLSCEAAKTDLLSRAARRIGYHFSPEGTDRVCGAVEQLPQGTSFAVAPRAGPRAGR
ncbi:MAG: MBL fold metallo-hydrolase [Gemmatimonadales bacterium]